MEIRKYGFELSVCKVEDYSGIDLAGEFVFTGSTGDELSLVCKVEDAPNNTTERDDGWRIMRIEGVLDFSLIGILSKIATVLAENKIGIFAISTYNTDYILVKAENYSRALAALEKAGYTII